MKYSPGDVCVVREWDDMAEEYGLTDGGSILCQGSFVPSMRPLCGMVFTVSKIDGNRYYSVENVESIGAESRPIKKWMISEEMLEPFKEAEQLGPVSIPGW